MNRRPKSNNQTFIFGKFRYPIPQGPFDDNSGNTCYVNAVLQLLYRASDFIGSLTKHTFQKYLGGNTGARRARENSLLFELQVREFLLFH